jgi:tetratricopeptide (TPR) repeat protein
LYGIMGDFRHAVPFLEQGLAVCREWNLKFVSPTLMEMLGYVHALSGRRSEGIALLDQAMSGGETIGFNMFPIPTIIHLGEAHLLAGAREKSLGLTERALTLARKDGQRGHESWALRLLGEIEAHMGRGTAEGHYRQALASATEPGLRPLMAHCHLGLGKLARQAGQPEQAREQFAAATTMWREMDVRFWFEQAEAELRQLGE